MNQTQLLLYAIVKGLQEKKGRSIVTVDLIETPGAICQYMVICEGRNPNQILSLSDSVWEIVHKEVNEKPIAIEGMKNAQWVGMDYGTIIVHILLPEMRAFYRLESLWEDSKIVQIPDLD